MTKSVNNREIDTAAKTLAGTDENRISPNLTSARILFLTSLLSKILNLESLVFIQTIYYVFVSLLFIALVSPSDFYSSFKFLSF